MKKNNLNLKEFILIILFFILTLWCSFYVFKENEKYAGIKSDLYITQQQSYFQKMSLNQKLKFFLRVINGIGKM